MSRPFTPLEQEAILSRLRSDGNDRDALLVEMGCYLGFRISELLSLQVDDVAKGGDVRAEIVVARRNLKGGKGKRCHAVRSRRIVVPERLQRSLREYLQQATLQAGSYLFQSREGGNRPLSRSQAHRIIVNAANTAGVHERIATHSLRRTFVQRIYILSGHDLIKTQRIVGHRSPLTTARYLETDQAELDALVRAQDGSPAPLPFCTLSSVDHRSA